MAGHSFGWHVWDKGFGLPGNWNGRLAPAHEFIIHFSKGRNRPSNKRVDKKPENVGKITHGTGMRGKDGKMSGMASPDAGCQLTKVADSVIRVSPHMERHRGIALQKPWMRVLRNSLLQPAFLNFPRFDPFAELALIMFKAMRLKAAKLAGA